MKFPIFALCSIVDLAEVFLSSWGKKTPSAREGRMSQVRNWAGGEGMRQATLLLWALDVLAAIIVLLVILRVGNDLYGV